MQVLKRHKIIALVLLLITIILPVSAVFTVQNIPKPSSNPPPSYTNVLFPSPTESTSTPTIYTTETPSNTPAPTLHPKPTPFLFPGEVVQYQDQNLTPISVYIDTINQHPDVAIKGTQYIDKSTYQLAITGLVNIPMNYTYNDVLDNFNSTSEVATLPCVEGWSATLLWEGVPIKDLLQQLGVSPNATTLIFLASDGYSTSLPLNYVIQNNITIAYKMNNVTLTPQTGWPFFLVAKNQYGYKWIEWLTEINVSNDSSYLGFWESRGYPNNATVVGFQNNPPLQAIFPIVLSIVIISIICLVVVFVHRLRTRKVKEINIEIVN
jgi:DMSO/TMAO reductase YedYZ molybdopterin-dependent catalytic subunit